MAIAYIQSAFNKEISNSGATPNFFHKCSSWHSRQGGRFWYHQLSQLIT